jgi:hypothetical protein
MRQNSEDRIQKPEFRIPPRVAAFKKFANDCHSEFCILNSSPDEFFPSPVH